MTDHLRVGHLELRLPPRCTVKLQRCNADRETVNAFMLASPDHTVYHHEAYFENARLDTDGGACELALFLQDGNAVFAMPLHVRRHHRVVTGYSGILLPPGANEAGLRRSIECLGAFSDANPRIAFEMTQAAQATGYDQPGRLTLLRRFLAELDVQMQPIFTRVIALDGSSSVVEGPGTFAGSIAVTGESLDNELLASYDGDARNQIRQALRRGLSVDVFFGDRGSGTEPAYELIQPLHEATWARSGWDTAVGAGLPTPHPLEYWRHLSAAVNAPEGASDLVVVVSDTDGSPVAGVVCHRYQCRALYWSACSSDGAGTTRANPLCLHAAISICAAAGDELFEIGRFDVRERSEKERAVTRYKSQFRGELLEVVNFSRPTARAKAPLVAARVRARGRELLARIRQ